MVSEGARRDEVRPLFGPYGFFSSCPPTFLLVGVFAAFLACSSSRHLCAALPARRCWSRESCFHICLLVPGLGWLEIFTMVCCRLGSFLLCGCLEGASKHLFGIV